MQASGLLALAAGKVADRAKCSATRRSSRSVRLGTAAGSFSWRVDETYVQVKGCWKYLYRAIDKDGATRFLPCQPAQRQGRPALASQRNWIC
jgi:transposase-like protein